MMQQCARCRGKLDEGRLRYRLVIKMICDFDGYIPTDERQNPDEAIEAMLRAMERLDAGELERQVYEERVYLLCPACRRRFMADPLNESPEAALPT